MLRALGRGPFSYRGRALPLAELDAQPKPVQRPRLPSDPRRLRRPRAAAPRRPPRRRVQRRLPDARGARRAAGPARPGLPRRRPRPGHAAAVGDAGRRGRRATGPRPTSARRPAARAAGEPRRRRSSARSRRPPRACRVRRRRAPAAMLQYLLHEDVDGVAAIGELAAPSATSTAAPRRMIPGVSVPRLTGHRPHASCMSGSQRVRRCAPAALIARQRGAAWFAAREILGPLAADLRLDHGRASRSAWRPGGGCGSGGDGARRLPRDPGRRPAGRRDRPGQLADRGRRHCRRCWSPRSSRRARRW